MDEQERIDTEEVEAHRSKAKYQVSEDASDDDDGEGAEADVEAHQMHRPPTSGG
jgi:hypothetical protein